MGAESRVVVEALSALYQLDWVMLKGGTMLAGDNSDIGM